MSHFQVQAIFPDGDRTTFIREGHSEREIALAVDAERLDGGDDFELHVAPLTDESSPYAQLAHNARRHRTHLRADKILPGDVVRLDGEVWTVTAVRVHPGVVRLVLAPRYAPELTRETMVEVVEKVRRRA